VFPCAWPPRPCALPGQPPVASVAPWARDWSASLHLLHRCSPSARLGCLARQEGFVHLIGGLVCLVLRQALLHPPPPHAPPSPQLPSRPHRFCEHCVVNCCANVMCASRR
jgi:hypothetical protein